jgi:Zn-dependent protease
MKKIFSSFKIFKIFGVDVKLHWSWGLIFFLFIDFGDPISQILVSALTVVMLFTFVLIHEFGHIFAARKYGVGCKGVNLNILGGVAMLDDGMEKLTPKQDLWMTFAGPLTNLVSFLLLVPFIGMVFIGDDGVVIDSETIGIWQMFYVMALMVNLMMFLFNLLPIYPMDGGRLLRSVLKLLKVKNDIKISIIVTLVLCIGLIIFGIWVGSWTMPLIGGLFGFMGISEWRDLKHEKDLKEIREMIKEKLIVALEKFDTDETKLQFLDAIEVKLHNEDDKLYIDNSKIIIDDLRRGIREVRD